MKIEKIENGVKITTSGYTFSYTNCTPEEMLKTWTPRDFQASSDEDCGVVFSPQDDQEEFENLVIELEKLI